MKVLRVPSPTKEITQCATYFFATRRVGLALQQHTVSNFIKHLGS